MTVPGIDAVVHRVGDIAGPDDAAARLRRGQCDGGR